MTEDLFISYSDLPRGPSHPSYTRLDKILRKHDFDSFWEDLCASCYAEVMGRSSIPPGVYFRMLMTGYFEGINSERAGWPGEWPIRRAWMAFWDTR